MEITGYDVGVSQTETDNYSMIEYQILSRLSKYVSIVDEKSCRKKTLIVRLRLHSFEANWSILKFAVGNRILEPLLSQLPFQTREIKSLCYFSVVHVKDL